MRIVVPDSRKAKALLVSESEEEDCVIEGLFDCKIERINLGHIENGNAALVFYLEYAPRYEQLERMWGKE